MFFSEQFLQRWNTPVRWGCIVHDVASDFLARYLKQIKIALLLMAHTSLLGLLFPQFAKSFGSLAQNLLLVILLVSPLSKLFRMKLLYQLMSLRRELGIWFAYAAIVHGVGYLSDPDWLSVFITPFTSHPSDMLPRYIFGILALLFTLPLLVTSNNISLRLLRGNWKKVHWLVYPMFACMLLHIFLPQRANATDELIGWLQFTLAFGGYIFLKVLAHHNFLTPLREVIEYIALQYKQYRDIKAR